MIQYSVRSGVGVATPGGIDMVRVLSMVISIVVGLGARIVTRAVRPHDLARARSDHVRRL